MAQKYEKLIQLALEEGFEKAEVYASQQSSFRVGVYGGHIENYNVSESSGLSLRGMMNGQMGYASTEVDEEEEYRDLVLRAKENALLLESTDEQFLYDGTEKLEWVSSVQPELEKITPEQKIAFAFALEKKCEELGGEGTRVDSCQVGTEKSSCTMANSLGLFRTFESNSAYALAEVVVEHEGKQFSGFSFRFSRKFEDLDPDAIAREALEDARKYINAGTVPSAQMPVVLEKHAMQTLLETFTGVFSAEKTQKGLSLLGGKEDSRIAASCVTLWDDPSDGLGLAGRPFDGEGVPTSKKAVVEHGKLNTLLYTLKSAKKAGKQTTGNAARASFQSTLATAPTNFYLEAGDKSPQELYRMAGNGVRIDELMGMHAGANQISGDFSLSCKGMEIRDGKLGAPVEQITVSGNFYTLLEQIQAVGNDLWFGLPGVYAVGAPSVLVEGLSIAGK